MTKTVTRLTAIILATMLAATTFSLYTFQASADWGGHEDRGDDGDKTEIEIKNQAQVSTRVSVTANTGGNSVDGGDSGDFGHGMIMPMRTPGGHSDGDAGPGGDGGNIYTGAATAYGTVFGDINSSDVTVEGCGCEQGSRFYFISRMFSYDSENSKKIEIDIENKADVRTNLDVMANTGRNSAEGGDSSGDGSSSYNPWAMWFGHNMDQDEGGGDGGTIRSGPAYADGYISGVINRSVVRVLNGDDEDDAPDPA